MHWLIYLVLGFIALLFLMQYLAVRRARRSEGQAAPDTRAVDGPAQADRRRLYYFYATRCGPCRAMAPLVDRLSATHRNLIKVDVAAAPDLARGFGIAATPSFILVEDGLIRQVRLGGQSEAQLLDWLA
ncbi:MAG: thioredoxin family protein [Hydrogenophilaceae bacterium]